MACVCLKIKGRTGIYVVKYLNVCYSYLQFASVLPSQTKVETWKSSAPCKRPRVSGGYVRPSIGPIDSGKNYTVTCERNKSMNGSSHMTCTNGQLSTAPTCFEGSTG